MRDYKLKATGQGVTELESLVSFVAERKAFKDKIWQMRQNKLIAMGSKMDSLISIYNEKNGQSPSNLKEKQLFYTSALAHQVYNALMGTKLTPDFIQFSPLGATYDQDLLDKTDQLTDAHRVWRIKGGHDKAVREAQKDHVWGNSFVEMSTKYSLDGDTALYTEYSHAPFYEMRGYYGDTDIMRIIEMSVERYAGEYGEEALENVTLGGILDAIDSYKKDIVEEEYDKSKEIIQVVRYYDPSRKIFAEIHGGNGYIFKHLEGDDYPFMNEDGTANDPFKESRFFDSPTSDYFGWSPLDYVIDLANLETTITNATAMEAIWEAGAPSILLTNDPDDMEVKLDKHWRQLGKGINRPIVQKDTGIGTKGQIQPMKKGVNNQNMQVWDDTVVSRAIRLSGTDVNALSDYAPTAEQQKLKKIEADKTNIRVLLVNEEREKEFAIKEMQLLKMGNTKFHNYKIEVVDEAARESQTEDGYIPTTKKKLKDILKDVKNIELVISPRMNGVLDGVDFLELQTMQEDIVMLPPGTAASDIAMEKYFKKKTPEWELKRTDFSTPTSPEQIAKGQAGQGAPDAPLSADPTQALTQQL